MEAKVILMRCKKCKKLFGIRVEKKKDGYWWRTWAFKISDKMAKNEGYDKQCVMEGMNSTENFPGCPYCQSMGFVVCGKCHKLTCYTDELELDCAWCGQHMTSITSADKFDLSAGDNF